MAWCSVITDHELLVIPDQVAQVRLYSRCKTPCCFEQEYPLLLVNLTYLLEEECVMLHSLALMFKNLCSVLVERSVVTLVELKTVGKSRHIRRDQINPNSQLPKENKSYHHIGLNSMTWSNLSYPTTVSMCPRICLCYISCHRNCNLIWSTFTNVLLGIGNHMTDDQKYISAVECRTPKYLL